MSKSRALVCTLALLSILPLGARAQFESVGTLDFPTSATGEAQQHFLRGVAILHSFGWKQAREEFQAAQRIAPDFAMAYWGESLAYNHPLISQMDPTEPRRVLARLAPTPEERLAKAPTQREKGFLHAVEILWGEGDHAERRIGYMDAMERLDRAYPGDIEIAAFYALSMLSAAVTDTGEPAPMPMAMPPAAGGDHAGHGAAPAGGAAADEHAGHGAVTAAAPMAPMPRSIAGQRARLNIQAGAITLGIFAAHPTHPGAPHYTIHAFDDPMHAPLALEAALRYADIAPAVSHARHMPTHIFIQRGMWELVSAHNQSAYDAARDLWAPGDEMGDAIHSADWGQYGDLQRGDYAKAQTWIRRMDAMANQGTFIGLAERGPTRQARAVSTLDLMRARYIVESEEWQVRPVTPESSPNELLATALSAYHLQDLETLQAAEAALANRPRSGTAEIIHKQVGALMHAAMGHAEPAIGLMNEAEALVEALPPPNGAATPIKPVHELFGELLLDFGRTGEAAQKFEESLLLMPNRPRSLLGHGRAYVALGQPMMAGPSYETIAEMWAGRESLQGMQEARMFWRIHLTDREHMMMGTMDYGRLGM
jgi:tetratricopeptide (TPR) repeat protein